jgi:hypothetical protein
VDALARRHVPNLAGSVDAAADAKVRPEVELRDAQAQVLKKKKEIRQEEGV